MEPALSHRPPLGRHDSLLEIGSGEQLTLLGPLIERRGPVPMPEEKLQTLWTLVHEAQRTGRATPALGPAFWDALPHPIRAGLQQTLATAPLGLPPRLVVTTQGATRAQYLPWESLSFGSSGHPQATRRLRVVRWLPGTPVHLSPLLAADPVWRVLLLVGDLRQTAWATAAEADVAEAIAAIAKAIGGPGVSLTVAQPRWRDPNGFASLADVARILDQSGFHVVHFLGHTDGEDPMDPLQPGQLRVAEHLCFQLSQDPKAPPALLPIAEPKHPGPSLVGALRHSPATRLLVLGACLTQEHVAGPLLQVVDHVVGMNAMVEPALATAVCGPLYQALASGEPLSQALGEARLALHTPHPDGFWIPAHWARNLDDEVLVDSAARDLRAYADKVADDLARLPGPLTEHLSAPDLLAQLYVQIDALPDDQGTHRLAQLDREPAAPHQTRALDALGRRGRPSLEHIVRLRSIDHPWFCGRYLLFGHAADGKTTVLRNLARLLASEKPLALVPIYLPLQDLVEALRPDAKDKAKDGWQHIAGEAVFAQVTRGIPQAKLGALRSTGRLVVLLDSLDEVRAEAGSDDRAAAMHLIRALEAVLADNVLVVASRRAGFPNDESLKLKPLALQGLLPEDRDQLLANWCRLLWPQRLQLPWLRAQSDPQSAATAIRARIEQSGALRRACENPLTVALLVHLVARAEGTVVLPTVRHELYHRCISFLLACDHKLNPRYTLDKAALTAGLDGLRQIALWMHERGRADLRQPTRLDRHELRPGVDEIAELAKALAAGRLCVASAPWRDTAGFLDYLREHAGLFVKKAPGVWGFAPKVFQDALAAEAFVAQSRKVSNLVALIRSQLRARPKDQLKNWGETLALVTSQLAKDQQKPWLERLHKIDRQLALRALASADPDVEVLRGFFQWGVDAGERRRVIEDLGVQIEDNEVLRPLVETVAMCTTDGDDLWHLDRLLRERGIPANAMDARLLAMSAPRPETWRDHFARIPTPNSFFRDRDWFLMGSPEDEDGRDEDETQQEIVLSQSFYLGRTPVTVAQYLEFDCSHDQWCFDKGWIRPARELDGQLPVINVSWCEAAMFARWLDLHRRHGPTHLWKDIIPDGYRCQLPTEAQWEWAARAGTRSRFWSGNSDQDLERVSWVNTNSDRRTHPVGQRRHNPWGLHDVHGNVWEWCATMLHEPSPGKTPRNGTHCVMRGGSFWCSLGRCRSAARNHHRAFLNWERLGFRLALGPTH